jgi:hypothetical protein
MVTKLSEDPAASISLEEEKRNETEETGSPKILVPFYQATICHILEKSIFKNKQF